MSIKIHDPNFNLEEAAEYLLKEIEKLDKNKKNESDRIKGRKNNVAAV